jgi:hypothetical protein
MPTAQAGAPAAAASSTSPSLSAPTAHPADRVALQNSNVAGNTLSAKAAVTLQAGGIFAQNEPVTLTSSVISQNTPDQRLGC